MKRKATDLKPNEAILISNDAERDAISKLFDESRLLWGNGEKVSNWISGYNYPYAFELVNSKVYHSTESDFLEQGFTIHPAADFIGSEGDMGVLTVSERDLLADYHNFILDDPRAKECDVVGECVELFLLTRNTPTNEQRTK